MATPYNPLYSVGGVDVPCPTSYTWKLSDVSSADAGRTESGLMDKMRIAQKVHLELSWEYISTADASTILNAFNPEYINIRYLDPKSGDYLTKNFYVGDRSVPMYNSRLGLWSNVSFNVIER